MNSKIKKTNMVRFVQLIMLTAIIVLMAFTPIGYLKAGALSITFLVIPVAVGAVTLGPWQGAFLGGVFGLTSFLQALGLDAFGVALFQISPVKTAVMCFVPRILMGYLCGLIFKLTDKFKWAKKTAASHFIANLSAALINTVLFMTALILLFGKTEYIMNIRNSVGGSNVLMFVILFVGINGVIEALTSTVVGTAISKAISVAVKKIH